MRTWPSSASRMAFCGRCGSAAMARSRPRRSYASSIALFLRWCARTGRTWQSGIEQLGLFMTWLAHAGEAAPDGSSGVVLAGPGVAPARGARRVNAVLAAVRGMTVHAVAAGQASGHLVPLLYEVADDRDLPDEARAGDGRMSWRMRARHRLREWRRRSTGPLMPISPRCWRRAGRRGTG